MSEYNEAEARSMGNESTGIESGQTQVFAYYHTHWDREWYQPFREYQMRLARVVDTVLERLDTGELPCFMLDGQTVVLEDYLELRPQNKARLRALIAKGILTIGPWFVAPDEFLVGGESLIRNLQRGIATSRAWGCEHYTGYLPDTFGHSADMPQIFRGFGIDSAILWRGVNPRHSEFFWESPSGDRVLAYHLKDGYMQNMLIEPGLAAEGRTTALSALLGKLQAASGTGMSLLPVGGDHLGPAGREGRGVLLHQVPDLEETTPERFMVRLDENIDAHALDTCHGELRDHTGAFLLPGVYSSRLYLKQANRRLEHTLTRRVEPLLAMAALWAPSEVAPYPLQELDIAWKTLLLNHPHDSICGCSVDAVHRENETRFDQVQAISEVLMRQAKARLAGSDDKAWVVFNGGDQPYTGVVPVVESALESSDLSPDVQPASEAIVLQDAYLYDIQELPLSHLTMSERQGWIWVEDVPPHGMRRIPKASATIADSDAFACGPKEIANTFYRLCINAEGCLDITDRAARQQYSGFLRFIDRADAGDSYNSAPVPGAAVNIAVLRGVEKVQSGPYVQSLRLTHSVSGMTLETTVTLQRGSRRIDFETHFTNTVADHKLQVEFATSAPVRSVWAESHFGLVTRAYDPDYNELVAMPASPFAELATNTGPIQRFFGANGHGFVTEGLSEYEVRGEALAITLVRAFSHLSKGDTGVRGAQAGPPFPTPEGQCLNRALSCRYAWLPVADPKADLPALYEEALRFYGVVHARSGCLPRDREDACSLVRWDNPAVVASAIYWLPDQGLVLRLLNTSAEPQSLQLQTGMDVAAVQAVDFNLSPLDPDGKIETGGRIQFPPHALQTLLLKKELE